jgi:8-amino-3,8-dideoxy-alpha-D-manno-octulosonate transaminase
MRGAPCNMDRLLEVARKHKLLVVEDTAQANGGSFRGKHLGTFGDLGAFSLQFNKMITTGEGGAVVTDDQERYRRAQMYHDGGGIWRRGEGITASLDELGQFTGVNFRMPEIVGAIAGVQLKRLDGLVAKQREIKARIIAGTRDICRKKGFAPRPSHDEAGDVGVCLIYLLPSAEAAKSVVAALRAEGISVGGMFDRNAEDLHVYYHWAPILKKRTANAVGCPWTCPYYKGEADMDQEACPKTLELLSRAMHIDITPLLSDEDVQATISAITKVAEALL